MKYFRLNLLLLFVVNNCIGQLSFFKAVENKGRAWNYYNNEGISVKHKIGNTWYFNGKDERGFELWKTDGTLEGTTIVKDLNVGPGDSHIGEMVSIGSTLYFTTSDGTSHLFKSDGTENGTVEVLPSGGGTFLVPNKLVASNSNLYFKDYFDTNQVLWYYDGISTKSIVSNEFNHYGIEQLISNGSLLFVMTANKIYTHQGSDLGLTKIVDYGLLKPMFPRFSLVFNNKIYFLARYFDDYASLEKEALFVTDGTINGTTIVKSFSHPYYRLLTESTLGFLEKTNDKLYFRVSNYDSGNIAFPDLDLWVSDGSTLGTIKVKTLSSEGTNGFSYPTFKSLNNQLYIFNAFNGGSKVWITNGTEQGTITIFDQLAEKGTSVFRTASPTINKMYFSPYDDSVGNELWETDGTISGTKLIGEVKSGIENSFVDNILNFDDKLLFWAYNSSKFEMWQYTAKICIGDKFISNKTGIWTSSDTWVCGQIPSTNDNVLIKSTHNIEVPEYFRTQIRSISTETGAFLNIPKSAVFTISPN